MAFTFTYVPPVASGDVITSTHRNTMAEAANDRLRSGLGDGPYRVMFYLFSLFRQVRNPDASFNLYPAQAEFFTAYQGINPDDYIWPVAGPGEAEGANLSSIMPLFVFGSSGANMYSEDSRIADPIYDGLPLWYGLGSPQVPEEIWTLGKWQRGAYDPLTGYYGSPSFKAAQEHFKVRPYAISPHGNSWGGYMPAPAQGSACTEPEFINYQIFFTNLESGATTSYTGTCPEDPTGINGIARGSRNYYVFLNDGTVDVLPINEWIEGPYTGGAWVSKKSGDHLPRVLNAFASEFRGTDDQVAAQESWLQHAFDTERFLSQQYHLAPARGNGDENGVGADYPQWNYSAAGGLTKSEGEPIFKADGTDAHYCHSDFVIASIFIKTEGLAGPTSIKLYVNGEDYETIAIDPFSDGSFQQIVTFDDAPNAVPLAIEWGADARFLDGSGSIVIEAAELLSYKPELNDLYLCLRLASCRTTLIRGMDGAGVHETASNEISDSYFENGCVLNNAGDPGPAGSPAEVNTNAIFDTARRLSKFVRIVPRQNFIGYEVTGGKSICYFLRRTVGGADIFDGIGPSRVRVETGAIIADRQYIVRSGTITYRDVNYVTDQIFTGVHEFTEFQGEGEVYEYNGIRATAEREGESNEWLMGQQFKVYHPSDSSLWKSDAYSDYWFLSERCHFQHNNLSEDLRWQFQYSSDNYIYAPESPTGWRYAKGSNEFPCTLGDTACEDARRDRYRSCRIYEPDPEIESATVLIEGGQEVLKLVFKTRFHHHHDTAPSSIDRDVSTWDAATINAETYRTTENGLREYLLWAHYGKQCTQGGEFETGQQGNAAANATVWTNPDNPYGACFPHFYFVKLLPKAYEDGNTAQNDHDTPLKADWWIQLELYMRAMCEGYVDGLTSTTLGCEVGINALFDYTMESLCFEAFGGKWFNTLATAETRYLENVRDDAPQGFGQLPNTTPAAEIYNQFASAMNLLTRVRIMLPLSFQVQLSHGTASRSVSDAVNSDGTPLLCSGSSGIDGHWTGTPPNAGAGSSDPWVDSLGADSVTFAVIDCATCSGDSWNITSSRTDAAWRWSFTDADAIYAIPDDWQDMAQNSSYLRVLGYRTRETSVIRMVTAEFADSDNCGGLGHWFDGTNYLKFQVVSSGVTNTCEVISASGSVSAQAIGSCDFPIGRSGAGDNCCGGVQNSEGITPITGQDVAFMEVPLSNAV